MCDGEGGVCVPHTVYVGDVRVCVCVFGGGGVPASSYDRQRERGDVYFDHTGAIHSWPSPTAVLLLHVVYVLLQAPLEVEQL